VPLFYEKRVPEVLLQNKDLSDEFYQILEDENLDEKQKEKLEKEFSKEIEIIKRDDRLETIARDIVYHFPRRGYLGKGMVISVDKFTSVKMYDKVQRYWKEEMKRLVGVISKSRNDIVKQSSKKILAYMRRVEMAVVISEEAGEDEKFDAQGLDIRPHRKKINAIDENGHDIEYCFKDPDDPFQLVFLCAMWMTGFDAPTVSTLYFDKPMKGHTLMQAIARANRVTSHTINKVTKINGEIIDYYNVFRNMKRAFADYALGSEGKADTPVQEKSVLFELLDDALKQGNEFCRNLGIELETVLKTWETFRNIELFDQYANKILEKDEWKKEFFVYENTITSLYEACKPEILGDTARPLVFVFQYLRGVIDGIINRQDVEEAKKRISALLDQSIVTDNKQKEYKEYKISKKGRTWNLSKINFEKLKKEFKEKKYKNIEIADLRAFIEDKLEKMIKQNTTRKDFAQRLQEIIDNYNAGGSTNEHYYGDLLNFTEGLKKEEERHIREGLTEDELELFDILKKEKMTRDEEKKVKLAAKSLLHRLLEEHPKVLIQDWHKDTQSQARVKAVVEKVLDDTLPKTYERNIFQTKCNNAFQLIFEYTSKGLKWAA
jgi:type I restriction enzyme R subunit